MSLNSQIAPARNDAMDEGEQPVYTEKQSME